MTRYASGARAGVTSGSLRLRLDSVRLTLCLFTILTISRIHQYSSLLSLLHPVLLVFGCVVLCVVLQPRAVAFPNLLRYWPGKVFVALVIWACVTAPFGISLGSSAHFIVTQFLPVVLYAFVLFMAIRSTRDLYTFVWAFVVATALLVWTSLFLFEMERWSGVGGEVVRLGSLYTYDANDLGSMLLVGLALTLLLVQTSTGTMRVFSAVVVVGIGVALARSGSRGAFVGLVGAGGWLLWSLKHVSVAKRVGIVVIVAGALIVAAPFGYWRQMGSVFDPKEDYNWNVYYGRKQLFERGVAYMLERPLFGLGINNFQRAEGTMTERAKDAWMLRIGERVRWAPPHNSFIQAGAELGLPGLALWSTLIVGGIVGMTRLRRRLPPAWMSGDPEQRFLYLATMYLPVALIGFALSAFFLSLAYYDVVYILAAFVSGMYVAVREKARRSGEPIFASGRRGYVPASFPPHTFPTPNPKTL